MDSDSLAASRIAGQMIPVSGVSFTAMWRTFKPESNFGFFGSDGAASGELRSYRRLADGDGR
ncbi:hypothetical protein SAMN04487948_10552 [Halogranum amylolyticum]|uniref:Uncharacterized protein n=1 Tax=Halogranum amylolyticum TaxID=660520 RepID=A0A1H8SFS6_9EURY|nr:hypothetical protein [Halogranum amylolyticum]SEO77407.1 hypothetical protein SAMN04487948_10552 [Halogranum amylolyticum]